MNHIEANIELINFNKNNTPHSLIINTFNEIINTKFKNYYHFYTDASKTTNETGFAITHRNENSLHKLDPLSNIYTAETFAILEATLTALSSNHDKILILSDSMSAVTSIANVHTKCNLAQSIQNIILSTDKSIKLMWVPSHIGIPGNELADELAMKAASSPDTKIYPIVTYDDVIHALKTKFYTLWQNQWEKQTNQNNKLRQIKPLTKKWPNPPVKLTRHEETIIARVRIGHTKITHSYLMLRELKPRCKTCNCKLTVSHIILECPIYHNARTKANINTSSLKDALGPGQEKTIVNFIKMADLTTNI
jgi:ribonuclease HI|uniref:ribonuclease H n=1 Tax=Sipha flava TaxID=143950 RepID=A0A2S2QP38_9HEMI